MKKILYILIGVLMPFWAISCSDEDNQNVMPSATGTMTDKDGNEYHWVRIGKLDWMTENLHCDTPFYDDRENPRFTNSLGNSWLYFANGDLTYQKQCYENFGNYYSWQEAVDNAPEGWRLPTDEDYKSLERSLGMKNSDVDKEGWRNGVADLLTQRDEGTMLNFRYGGQICNYDFSFISLYREYDYGYYWTATDTTEHNEPAAWARVITPGRNAVKRTLVLQQQHCLSVRYVRDAK